MLYKKLNEYNFNEYKSDKRTNKILDHRENKNVGDLGNWMNSMEAG